MFSFVSYQVKGQIFVLDFDIGSELNCHSYQDWIQDGEVYLKYPEIPVKSLSGEEGVHNFLTNDKCDTWIYDSGLNIGSTEIIGNSDRKLIVQKYADVGPFNDKDNNMSLGGQLGILLDIPVSLMKDNYFYEIKYDMYQLFDTNCVRIIETFPIEVKETLGTPTISLYYNYKYDSDDDIDGFIENDHYHNLAVKSTVEFLGEFTTKVKLAGVYTSPVYKFAVYDNPLPTSICQIALFVTANLAGKCDNPQGRGPLAERPMAALVDNLAIDCDQKNIAFYLDVTPAQPEELTSCAYNHVFKTELSTSCPSVNYNNFPYYITVTNEQNQVVRDVYHTGKSAFIDLDGLPDGIYTFKIEYDDTGGYNAGVKEYIPNNSRQIKMVNLVNQAYLVTGTEEITGDAYMATDIIIMSGGQLTVSGTLYMKDDALIDVRSGGKLEITTTGHITACESMWYGVLVKGTGEVYTQGMLSKSITGIKSHQDANGKIHSNGAQFFDNQLVNIHVLGATEISVEGTDFIGGERGVYLINVTGGTTPNGVLFDGNRFSYQTKEGILAINTPINVRNGNQFIGCHEAISSRNLFGNFVESMIDGYYGASNVFTNCDIGVYANASTQKVKNNIFNFCNNATWMSGLNGYESEFNSFTGGYNAEGLFSAGTNSNISEHNDHRGSVYSIRAYFDNDNYTFLANCFNSAGTDVEAYGTVSGAQGNEILAASNCFTHVNYVIDLDCNTNQFQYFVPDSTIAYPSCLDPMTPGTYDIMANSISSNEGKCGSSLTTPFIGEYDYIKALGCDSIRIHTYILDYRAQLKTLLRKQVPLTKAERASVAWLTRHLRYLISQWAWCLRKQGKNPELYEWYRSQEDKDYAINAVGVRVSMQQYESALAELDQIQTDYEMNPSLIAAMKLNVIYMRTDMTPDSISPAQLDLLRSVAAMSDPYAAYGRSLLYLLTEEKIEPALPSNVHHRSDASVNAPIKETYRVYPNPASDILNISIDNMGMYDSYQYELRDVTGRNLIRGNIYHDTSVDIASLSGGIYFLNILKNKEWVSNQKIAITK